MRNILIFLFAVIPFVGFSQVQMMMSDTAATGGGGFVDPTSVTSATLKLWLDGNDIDGDGSVEGLGEAGLTNTDEILAWVDKSANVYNFSVNEGAPILQDDGGGSWAVAGDGNDNFISDNAASEWTSLHSGDISVFAKFEIDNVNSGTTHILFSSISSSSSNTGVYVSWSDVGGGQNLDKDMFIINSNSTTNRPVYHSSDIGSDFTSSNTYYDVLTYIDPANGTNADRLQGEIDEVSKSTLVNPIANLGVASGSSPSYTLHLFCRAGLDDTEFVGAVKELVVFEGELSAQDKSDMYTWLATQ